MIRPQAFQRQDARLVRDVVAGDAIAQEALFDRYVADVERLLYRLLGNDGDIADAIQDVFLQVFKHIGKLRDPAALKGWLRAITVATARKRIRSKARRRWLRFVRSEDVPDMPASEADDEVLAALRATYLILDGMSVELRIVFALRRLEGLELSELADACGVSLATVKRRLRKADDVFAARARRDPDLVDWVGPKP